MSGLGFFQFVPQPVKILVSSTNRIFWQVKLHPSTLQMRTVEQNQGKGRVAYLGRMEGKKLSLNNLGKNTLFFHQTHQPSGRAYQHGMTSPGHGVQLKISRSRMKMSRFHFPLSQEMELSLRIVLGNI